MLSVLQEQILGTTQLKVLTFTHAFQACRSIPADLVNCLVQMLLDMESIKNVNCIATPLTDRIQVRTPHVAANLLDFIRQFGYPYPATIQHREKADQRFHLSLKTDMKQAYSVFIDLVNRRYKCSPNAITDFIDSNRLDPL